MSTMLVATAKNGYNPSPYDDCFICGDPKGTGRPRKLMWLCNRCNRKIPVKQLGMTEFCRVMGYNPETQWAEAQVPYGEYRVGPDKTFAEYRERKSKQAPDA